MVQYILRLNPELDGIPVGRLLCGRLIEIAHPRAHPKTSAHRKINNELCRSLPIVSRNNSLSHERTAIKCSPSGDDDTRPVKVCCEGRPIVELTVPIQVLSHHNVEWRSTRRSQIP